MGCFRFGKGVIFMSFLESIGLIAISLLVFYIIKKISNYIDWKRISYPQNEKVYRAAGEFVQGASYYDVMNLLESCIDFDGEDAAEIWAKALPHRTDEDGGYGAFIKAVNRVLGKDIYSESPRTD